MYRTIDNIMRSHNNEYVSRVKTEEKKLGRKWCIVIVIIFTRTIRAFDATPGTGVLLSKWKQMWDKLFWNLFVLFLINSLSLAYIFVKSQWWYGVRILSSAFRTQKIGFVFIYRINLYEAIFESSP